MSVFLAVLVWLVTLSSGKGPHEACRILDAAVSDYFQEWVGYPIGWIGYDDGQGEWVYLPIDSQSGMLLINQPDDGEIWLFVMRSTNNHDFCGPYLFSAP